jgi:hypothetical protein
MIGWAPAVGVFVGLFVARLLMVPFDRRRRWRAGRLDTPPWTGNCARYAVLDLDLANDRIDAVALAALRLSGARPESRRDGWP